jgi:hypothetical protein
VSLCFKLLTKVLDDGTFGYTPGKARLILDRDSARDGQGTNVPRARVVSPDLDDSSRRPYRTGVRPNELRLIDHHQGATLDLYERNAINLNP